MGCDIHAFYEIKVKGKWEFYAPADFTRNYDFFSRLANVRNDGTIVPIDCPRGLPTDVSYMVSLHNRVWDVDGHSHSWVNSKEYDGLMDEFTAQQLNGSSNTWDEPGRQYLFGNPFHSWHNYPEDYPDFIEDFRLVFWFDN